MLHLYNNVDKWGATIILVDKSKYDNNLFSDYDKLEEEIKKRDSSAEFKNRKIVEDKNIISFEKYGTDRNSIIAYVPAYDNYEYEIVIHAGGDDKEINYDALDIVIDILSKRYVIAEDGSKIKK